MFVHYTWISPMACGTNYYFDCHGLLGGGGGGISNFVMWPCDFYLHPWLQNNICLDMIGQLKSAENYAFINQTLVKIPF